MVKKESLWSAIKVACAAEVLKAKEKSKEWEELEERERLEELNIFVYRFIELEVIKAWQKESTILTGTNDIQGEPIPSDYPAPVGPLEITTAGRMKVFKHLFGDTIIDKAQQKSYTNENITICVDKDKVHQEVRNMIPSSFDIPNPVGLYRIKVSLNYTCAIT